MRQAESGAAVGEICRKMGVSKPTFCGWKKQFAGMDVAEIRHLEELEEENAKLKRQAVDSTLGPTTTASTRRPAGAASRFNGEGRIGRGR